MVAPRKRVLIVDDEISVAQMLRKRLEMAHFEVLVALDGMEGLEKARREPPDIIILDCMLPRMNGFEVCTLLKQDHRYEHIPVLMLTARATAADRQDGLKCGADVYVTKPYQAEELLRHIQTLLSRIPS